MLFMVIERFKGRDPAPIYKRVRESGRSLPDGLRYIDSWVEVNFDRCFQLMECNDSRLLMDWVLQWRLSVCPVAALWLSRHADRHRLAQRDVTIDWADPVLQFLEA